MRCCASWFPAASGKRSPQLMPPASSARSRRPGSLPKLAASSPQPSWKTCTAWITQLRQTNKKLAATVKTCGTTLTEVFGVGPVIAGTVIGDVRNISRFASRDHFASYNGTAPVEVSSGNRKTTGCPCAGTGGSTTPSTWPRSPRSATATAKAAPTTTKRWPKATHKEALRSLKRRISDAVYAQLLADARQATAARPEGPGGQPGNGSVSSAAARTPKHRLFGQATKKSDLRALGSDFREEHGRS